MKICWDNLEEIHLTKNGYFIKGTVTYEYKESCKECKQPYLCEKRRQNKFCSRDCVNKSEEYRKLKSKLQKGKPSAMKGKNLSKEVKEKISEAHKGKKLTKEHKRKISIGTKGIKKSCEVRRRISKALKGRKFSEKTKKKMKENHADFNLDKHPRWKGGKSFEPYCLNWTKKYKNEIKERDGNMCLNPVCMKIQKKLSVHHIDYNKKNCGPNNLITLCSSCNSRANSNRSWHRSWYTAIMYRRKSNGA